MTYSNISNMSSKLSQYYVIKRDGRKENVHFDKITQRISKLLTGDMNKNIDIINIVKKTITSIYPGITTKELDNQSAYQCGMMTPIHYDYALLAGRIYVSSLHKETMKTFVEKMELINDNLHIYDYEWLEFIKKHRNKLNKIIDYNRDYSFDFFGIKTMERTYITKVDGQLIERPQDVFMRVASLVHCGDLQKTIDSYNLMSKKYFTHASPTLFNAGNKTGNLVSCFLLGTEDSISGISKTWNDVSHISKWGGGIGIHISNIRSKGTEIRSTNGHSDGIVPMLQVYNSICRYVNQCFTPDTPIFTEDGFIDIENIKQNSKVMTSDGTFRNVNKIFKNNVNKNILKISTTHSFEDIKCTEEHDILVYQNISNNNLQQITQLLKTTNYEPTFVKASELKAGDFMVIPKIKLTKQTTYTPDDYYFLGLFLGKGNMILNINTKIVQGIITLNNESTYQFVKNYLTSKNICFNKIRDNSTLKWDIPKNFIISYNDLYIDNHIKQFPSKFITGDNNKLLKLVKGLIDSSGNINQEIIFSSPSKKIALALRYILIVLGIPSIGNFINNYIIKIPKVNIITNMYNIKPDNTFNYIELEDSILIEIINISTFEYSGYVYDLNIDENHNYLTSSGIVHNSGRRKGSFAFYLEPHHADVFDFLELRKNTGAESERARDLFLALWVSDLFMNQVKSNNDWYLFCPDKAPGLNDVYGEEYESLYWKYVSEEKYNKKIKARKLWEAIMTSQFETGSPYMLYKDNINKKSNQKNIGIIRSSNLCAEIVEYSDSNETAACNLASIALPNFIKSKNFNDDGLIVYCKPNCIYCKWVKQMLINKNIKFKEILIEMDSKELQLLKQKLGKELITFPQVFLHDTLIGGMEETWFYLGKEFDYDKLWNVAYHVTQNLDSVIDKNYYPTKESRRSNMKHRPIGLGVQGLADTLSLLRVPYASKTALDINEKIFGTIYHAAVTASVDIAKEREEDMKLLLKYFEEHPKKKPLGEFYDETFECYPKKIEKIYHKLRPHSTELLKTQYLGTYSTFEGSPFSEGKLQYHLWNRTPINISTLIEGKSWETLINEMKKYGTRNSLLTALMPTASTSQLLGNYESFEPFTSNIYTRRTLAGEFIVVNKHLVNDLNEIGEWTDEIRQQVITDNGSIQNLLLPSIIKSVYQTSYEMKQKYIIDGCTARGAYIDQTQSMNLYFAQPDSQKLTSSQFYAWEQGLKTGLYYLRSKPSANATKITVSTNSLNKNVIEVDDDEGCVMCSA